MSGYAGLVGRHVRIGVILQDHGVVAVVELAQVAPEAEPPPPSSLVGVESREVRGDGDKETPRGR